MQRLGKDCTKWNAEQLAKAMKVLEQEKQRGNRYVLTKPDKVIIYPLSGNQMGTCTESPTGCYFYESGDLGVNVDREPAAIAFTIQHELQHGVNVEAGVAPGDPSDERCAKARAVNFMFAASREVYDEIRRDRYHYESPRSVYGCAGF